MQDDLHQRMKAKENSQLELDGIISKQMEDAAKLTEARDKMSHDCTQLKETVAGKEVGWKFYLRLLGGFY